MSLQRQIGVGILVAAVLAAVVLFYWGNVGVDNLLRDYVVTRLQHDADSVAAALNKSADGQWHIESARLGPIYERVYSGHYYRVVGESTDIRSRSLWDYQVKVDGLTTGGGMEGRLTGPREQRLLSWTQGIRKSGDSLTLWIAEDISHLDPARRRYSLIAVTALAAIIALLVAAQHWILRRGFSRLESVRSAVRSLRSGHIDSLAAEVPREVEPLVREINRLLVRLDGKVARSRNAMGNLAHEMKRPLHRLRHLAARSESDTGRELKAAIDDVESLVSRELKRARIVGVATPGRQTRLDDDIPVLVAALENMYPGRTITTEYSPGLVLPHDRDDMLELFGNLLDNALKHGAGEVTLRVIENETGWVIAVEDHGPGIPGADICRVLERGARLDETRGGSGLGLGICADIVREYGGRLDLANRESGGLRVSVKLDHETG